MQTSPIYQLTSFFPTVLSNLLGKVFRTRDNNTKFIDNTETETIQVVVQSSVSVPANLDDDGITAWLGTDNWDHSIT